MNSFLNIFFLMIFLAVPLHAAQPPTIPASMGVNIHFLDDNLDQHIALLKEAGLGWVRKDIFWSQVEKEKGIYDFTHYDALINALDAAGLKILLILDYRNQFYDDGHSPYTHEGREAFTRYAQAAAQRYKNKNVAWEIYNEPNHRQFWRPTPHVRNYIVLAEMVTAMLRHTVPHQKIYGPALAGPTRTLVDPSLIYLEKVLQSPVAKTWDGITIHPYRFPRTPETIVKEMPRLQALLKKHGITAPLIFGEWGYHTSSKGVDEELQAAYAMRSFLLAARYNMPFSIWYNWQERGSDKDEPEDQYGLIRYQTLEKKPAFDAIKNMAMQLKGFRFDKIIETDDRVMCLRFKKGRRIAYAAWALGNHTIDYTIHGHEVALDKTPLIFTP